MFTSLVAALVGLFRKDESPASGADAPSSEDDAWCEITAWAGYWDDRCTWCGVKHPIYEVERLDPWVRFRARPSLV